MSMSAIRASAQAVAEVPIEDRAFAAAALGEALELELADPTVLVEIGAQLVRLAHSRGCTALAGASSLGDRLAAAAVAISGNGLHLRRPHDDDPVLIIDGIMVTGSQIFELANKVRADGASKASAAVVIATSHPDLYPLIDELVVLEA